MIASSENFWHASHQMRNVSGAKVSRPID